MIRFNKYLNKNQIKNFFLYLGFATVSLAFLELIIYFITYDNINSLIILILIFPGISAWFDGFQNIFVLKKVEILKISVGFFMIIYNLIIFIFYTIDLWTIINYVYYLLLINLLLIGVTKIIEGKINIEYKQWYRKLLGLTGTTIIVLTLIIYSLIIIGINFFAILIFLILNFDGIPNIIYSRSENIEKK
ncbi:MAG: hypothetical protein ACFFCY_15895 [Promethearchaeota archaeon]